jgi:hypothetical protein
MERRDYLLNDIEKIGVVIATLLRLKGRKKDGPDMLEIHNGLSELFGLDLRSENMESLTSKVSVISEPEKLNYLIQLLELEMENDKLEPDEFTFRQELLGFTQKHLEAKYADLKIATFFGQSKKI